MWPCFKPCGPSALSALWATTVVQRFFLGSQGTYSSVSWDKMLSLSCKGRFFDASWVVSQHADTALHVLSAHGMAQPTSLTLEGLA